MNSNINFNECKFCLNRHHIQQQQILDHIYFWLVYYVLDTLHIVVEIYKESSMGREISFDLSHQSGIETEQCNIFINAIQENFSGVGFDWLWELTRDILRDFPVVHIFRPDCLQQQQIIRHSNWLLASVFRPSQVFWWWSYIYRNSLSLTTSCLLFCWLLMYL